MTPPDTSADPLVTVVIPAYNAAATIDETLRSVRAQTHRNLDIIVVDDGSSDDTGTLARAHAAVDPRIRVERQANAGVAAARNRGWEQGRAALFSFVDADDLWSADKTERQLAALRAMPEAGLVYSWYVIIDAQSRITLQWDGCEWEGDVTRRLLLENFIGNGSSVLVTRQALEDARGFEPGLRAADAGGCEDILFYLRVAERHRVALAPGYLIGYQFLEGNMSSDLTRMLRSWMLVQQELRARHPDKSADIEAGFDRFARWLVRRAIEHSQPRQVPRLLRLVAGKSPLQALAILSGVVPKAIRDFGRHPFAPKGGWRPVPGPRFEIGTPMPAASGAGSAFED